MAGHSMLYARGYRGMKTVDVGHRVIGGHHDHDAVLILRGDRQGGDRQRRRRVASNGLKNQPARLAARAQLLGRGETMLLIGHHNELLGEEMTGFESVETARRGLQQRIFA
jgi:hypothetical protein